MKNYWKVKLRSETKPRINQLFRTSKQLSADFIFFNIWWLAIKYLDKYSIEEVGFKKFLIRTIAIILLLILLNKAILISGFSVMLDYNPIPILSTFIPWIFFYLVKWHSFLSFLFFHINFLFLMQLINRLLYWRYGVDDSFFEIMKMKNLFLIV